jgi:hypothetical protein
MKLEKALKIINESERGFMVSFEIKEGNVLKSDYFPEKEHESLIKTEKEAWDLAKRFAKATGSEIVNIYVIDQDYAPVKGYSNKKLKKY